MNKVKSFLTDQDGFSAKDFLMVLCVGIFVIQQTILFVLSLMGDVNPQTIELLDRYDAIVLTIIGGVFSLHAVHEFRQPKRDTPPPNDHNQF